MVSGGPRLGAIALLLTVLTLGSAQAAPWLQANADAARTGMALDDGPVLDDVAFSVGLEGRPVRVLLVNGAAYVLSTPKNATVPNLAYVHRVDLATAVSTTFIELPIGRRPLLPAGPQPPAIDRPIDVASDGERLFVLTTFDVLAFDLADGEPLWTLPLPGVNELHAGQPAFCVPPAVLEGQLFVTCRRLIANPAAYRVFTLAIDVAAGTVDWMWSKSSTEDSPFTVPVGDGCDAAGSMTCNPGAQGYQVHAMAVIGPLVVVSLVDTNGLRSYHVLDRADGSFRSRFVAFDRDDPPTSPRPQRCRDGFVDADGPSFCVPLDSAASTTPTGSATELFVRPGRMIRSVDPNQGEERWKADLESDGRNSVFRGNSLAFDGATVFATSYLSVYRFKDGALVQDWPVAVLAPDEHWTQDLVLSGGRLYAQSISDDGEDALYALDADDGRIQWRHDLSKPMTSVRSRIGPVESPTGRNITFAETGIRFSVGEGIIAVAHVRGPLDGNLTILGRTAASLAPVADVSSEYPSVGDEVTVDLSGTAPGLFGPATSFRTDWGDGEVTEWQSSPVLTHAYAEDGDKVARLMARNDANQTSSVLMTFHVGATEPNFLATAFQADNQDVTFGVLGLTGTAVGGAYGLTRLTSRRRRLTREMRLVDDAYAKTKDRAAECEAALAERKAHARGLLLDGKFDESQFSVLKRHIDDLARNLRLSTLDQRFDFLPHGMVRTLRDMLSDGRVSEWEHRHFLEALERDTMLTPEYKARVRELVDSWFDRDAGRSTSVEIRHK
ncbi:MAG TPA: PQQ-binding-like beta-propeller repeat protein [Candidatus Thermoplasmatota archaeon]|nr:PQQ-binding-like beta-propeller repeat protein [Candidatus Thermoplasmatota archaeon]